MSYYVGVKKSHTLLEHEWWLAVDSRFCSAMVQASGHEDPGGGMDIDNGGKDKALSRFLFSSFVQIIFQLQLSILLSA